MEAVLWIGLPGFVALASGVLAWFVMQSRMEVALAQQRAELAEAKGALEAERTALRTSLESSVKAAEETARRESLDTFLGDLQVEQRHFTRENRMLMQSRRSVVLQERMYFRNIPLSDWIEHEIVLEDGADMDRIVRDMTVFDKPVVGIGEVPRRKQLA